jgi:hypothetical protein
MNPAMRFTPYPPQLNNKFRVKFFRPVKSEWLSARGGGGESMSGSAKGDAEIYQKEDSAPWKRPLDFPECGAGVVVPHPVVPASYSKEESLHLCRAIRADDWNPRTGSDQF